MERYGCSCDMTKSRRHSSKELIRCCFGLFRYEMRSGGGGGFYLQATPLHSVPCNTYVILLHAPTVLWLLLFWFSGEITIS